MEQHGRQLFVKDLLGLILLDSDNVGILDFLLMDACQTLTDAKGDNPVKTAYVRISDFPKK